MPPPREPWVWIYCNHLSTLWNKCLQNPLTKFVFYLLPIAVQNGPYKHIWKYVACCLVEWTFISIIMTATTTVSCDWSDSISPLRQRWRGSVIFILFNIYEGVRRSVFSVFSPTVTQARLPRLYPKPSKSCFVYYWGRKVWLRIEWAGINFLPISFYNLFSKIHMFKKMFEATSQPINNGL